MKLYMFRTVRLSIIRSLFTVNSEMVYAIQLSSKTRMVLLEGCLQTCQLSETCTVLWQNKSAKSVQLVGFIAKRNCYDARSHERKKKSHQ